MEESMKSIYVTIINFNSKKQDTVSIKHQGFCFLSPYDFETLRKNKSKQKQNLSSSEYNYYKWYNSILRYEVNTCSKECKLRINQYEIQTGNFNAFCINGDYYPTVTIILSEEMKHWYYAVPGSELMYLCGSKVLDKNEAIIEKLDILKRKQRALRPEPNDDLFCILKNAYAQEPSVILIPKAPYFECRYEPSLDCLDSVCTCDNLTRFDKMFEATKHAYGGEGKVSIFRKKISSKCVHDKENKSPKLYNKILSQIKAAHTLKFQ